MRDWYIGTKIFVVSVIVLFATTGVVLAYTQYFGPKFEDQRTNQYQHSKVHRDAVVQRFSDLCRQRAQTGDDFVAKKAIDGEIATMASTENLDDLQMNTTVRTCVNDAIKEYSSGN